MWKWHPGGGRSGLGMSPCSSVRARRACGLDAGVAASSACVYGCSGASYSASVGATSTMRPRYITATRSLMCRTTASPCATISSVSPRRSFSSSSRFTICACTDTSSAETGSSPRISRGSDASARAMPMRWRCPPLNSCGLRSICAGDSPTVRSSSATRSRRSDAGARRCSQIGSPTIRSTLMRGLSEANGSWNTTCISRRSRASAAGASSPMLRPSNSTSPALGSISRSSSRPSVDLPDPLSPTSASVSPGCTDSDTSSTARTTAARPNSPPPPPKCRLSPTASRIGRPNRAGVTPKPRKNGLCPNPPKARGLWKPLP